MDTGKIFEEYGFSESEKKFIKDSNDATTAYMNQSRVLSNLMLGKKLEMITDKLIVSNKKVSDSTDFYSKVMIGLTAALVIVGLLQVFVPAFLPK